ncbi:MAG: initiation-control protein YabA [Halothermotrichaceae bacterium]
MNQEILSALAHFQEQIEEMSMRFQKLKDITFELYQENEELKQENNELRKVVFKRQKSGGKGHSNLMDLYKEGYHVCHSSFGEKRKGDCLFCQNLIDRQLEEQ